MKFAKFKLCNGQREAYDADSYLAVITCRVMAEFPLHHISAANLDNARNKDAKLVAAHMRTVYSIPSHREYMRTGYSSEPLLAEVAAQVMHDEPLRTWEAFKNCLENELISKGERGEAIVRYLLIRGYDVARKWDRKSPFSKPVKLLDFLKSLFGEANYELIKQFKAYNVPGESSSTLEVAFKDAYVYFTHFVRAADSSVVTDVCTLVALSHGMAWQCYPEEADFDIVIGVAFAKNTDEALDRSKITLLALQVKNRKTERPVFVDADSFFTGKADTRPYIVVVVELGLDRAGDRVVVKSQITEQNYESGDHPCYYFSVYGCDKKSFGVLEKGKEGAFDTFLHSDDLFDGLPREENLKTAVKMLRPFWSADLCYVETAPEEHMEIE